MPDDDVEARHQAHLDIANSRAVALHGALRDRDTRLRSLTARVAELERRERAWLLTDPRAPAGTRQQSSALHQATVLRVRSAAAASRALADAYVAASKRRPIAALVRRADPSTALPRVLGPAARVFDETHYVERYPDVVGSGLPPVLHYRRHGWRQDRAPHPWFEPAWYRSQGSVPPGVELTGHYLDTGWREGRDPHPLFDSDWYAATHALSPDDNPLLHWLEVGRPAGLSTHPLFDVDWYRGEGPEISGDVSPVEHFLAEGWTEGRNPHPLFDVVFYLEANAGTAASGSNPLVHYLTTGWKQGADPHPTFDVDWYRREHREVFTSGAEPLTHYVLIGRPRGDVTAPN